MDYTRAVAIITGSNQAPIFVLVTIAMTVQSTNHIAPQAVYRKLEHALITDSKLR